MGNFKLYSDSWVVKARDQQVDGIPLKLKDFNVNNLQTSMKHTKTNLRKEASGGVFAIFKRYFFSLRWLLFRNK
jgi:hypothetical protein